LRNCGVLVAPNLKITYSNREILNGLGAATPRATGSLSLSTSDFGSTSRTAGRMVRVHAHCARRPKVGAVAPARTGTGPTIRRRHVDAARGRGRRRRVRLAWTSPLPHTVSRALPAARGHECPGPEPLASGPPRPAWAGRGGRAPPRGMGRMAPSRAAIPYRAADSRFGANSKFRSHPFRVGSLARLSAGLQTATVTAALEAALQRPQRAPASVYGIIMTQPEAASGLGPGAVAVDCHGCDSG
jgi:hypothetical protein